jgi:hypothetical protein
VAVVIPGDRSFSSLLEPDPCRSPGSVPFCPNGQRSSRNPGDSRWHPLRFGRPYREFGDGRAGGRNGGPDGDDTRD